MAVTMAAVKIKARVSVGLGKYKVLVWGNTKCWSKEIQGVGLGKYKVLV